MTPSIIHLHLQLLSPRNASRTGYSYTAVVPSVRPSVSQSIRQCVTPYPCERNSDSTVVYFFIKLDSHYKERIRGQRSKFKVTIDIYGSKLVNMIETKPLCAISSNLADILAKVRRWTLLILSVRGQKSSSQLTCMEISL